MLRMIKGIVIAALSVGAVVLVATQVINSGPPAEAVHHCENTVGYHNAQQYTANSDHIKEHDYFGSIYGSCANAYDLNFDDYRGISGRIRVPNQWPGNLTTSDVQDLDFLTIAMTMDFEECGHIAVGVYAGKGVNDFSRYQADGYGKSIEMIPCSGPTQKFDLGDAPLGGKNKWKIYYNPPTDEWKVKLGGVVRKSFSADTYFNGATSGVARAHLEVGDFECYSDHPQYPTYIYDCGNPPKIDLGGQSTGRIGYGNPSHQDKALRLKRVDNNNWTLWDTSLPHGYTGRYQERCGFMDGINPEGYKIFRVDTDDNFYDAYFRSIDPAESC